MPARPTAPARIWIPEKNGRRATERRDVLNAMRAVLQAGQPSHSNASAMAWLSRRTLTRRVLYRGNAHAMKIVDELVAEGYLCRVSAPGRGHGKGRTLYWLPGARKANVLRELKRERMPVSAIVHALGFFVQLENGPAEDRSQSLRSSTSGTEPEKGTRAALARRSRSPGGPPLRVLPPPSNPSAPPSLGRLTKRGWTPAPPADSAAIVAAVLNRGSMRPERITDDPATHPEFCECADCLARRPSPEGQ